MAKGNRGLPFNTTRRDEAIAATQTAARKRRRNIAATLVAERTVDPPPAPASSLGWVSPDTGIDALHRPQRSSAWPGPGGLPSTPLGATTEQQVSPVGVTSLTGHSMPEVSGYVVGAHGSSPYGGEQAGIDEAGTPPRVVELQGRSTSMMTGSAAPDNQHLVQNALYRGEATFPADENVVPPSAERPVAHVRQTKRTRANRAATVKTRSAKSRPINRAVALDYSRILIAAFQEAIDYGAVQGRNERHPPLWINDPAYIAEIKSLVAELQRLNDLLEAKKKPVKKQASIFARHVDKFLQSYTKHLGIGAAYLTIGCLATYLKSMGIDFEMNVLRHR